MTTQTFTIKINAAPEQVWIALWDPENYKTWTNSFCAGSYYTADKLVQGGRIHFLTPNGEGMFSNIDTLEQNQYMAFKHLGELKNFEEMPVTDEVKTWAGAMETYRLNKVEGGTELTVVVDTIDEYVDFMNKAFPSALEEVRRISETK